MKCPHCSIPINSTLQLKRKKTPGSPSWYRFTLSQTSSFDYSCPNCGKNIIVRRNKIWIRVMLITVLVLQFTNKNNNALLFIVCLVVILYSMIKAAMGTRLDKKG